MLRDKIGEELFAALFPATVEAVNITPALFMERISEGGIRCTVEWFRLKLEGGNPQERERLIGIVHSNPDLEARIILRIAVKDRDVMDAIEERASIRWVEGYSDSLYSAVLSSIVDMEEHPSKWSIDSPKADWEAEKREYEA